eukprot:g10361.t1
MYDTFMAEPFSAPEPPAGRTAPAEDSTQAYEAVPGGIPQAFQVTPTPAMAATQEYGDTLVLEHEGDTQEVAELDTSGAASSSASKSGLKRLFGKQPPPPGYKPPKRPRTSRGSKRATAAASPRARPASSLPPMAGCRVRVTGDGWGGGTGEYEATVVDGDDLSYTIIYIGDDKKYTDSCLSFETHVLQEHCTLLEPPSEASTSRATPSFVKAVDLLTARGGQIHNDHMALRSFVDSEGRSGLKFFESIFTHFGYAVQDSLVIPGLCVNARWTNWPKVFVSEMRIKELPEVAQEVLFRHVDGFYEPSRAEGALANGSAAVAELLETPPWCPTAEEQQTLHQLAKEPHLTNAVEYAAWTLTHGHRINHVTILLNTLGIAGVNTLADLNALLQSEGLVFNAAGGSDGLTQGSVEVSLEQSSTIADVVPHRFACGAQQTVPCSFLELIQRHEGFRGFLGQNAKGGAFWCERRFNDSMSRAS